MSGESDPDRMLCWQDTVWPPPPQVSQREPAADPYQENASASLRSLNTSIFLFVGGSVLPIIVLPAILLLFSTVAPHLSQRMPSFPGLRYLWPLFYILGAYFGIKAFLLAKRAKKRGIQIQSCIITVLSVLCIPVSLHLISL